MPQTTPRTARLQNGRTVTLHPVSSLLTPRTRELLRAIERERYAAGSRVLCPSRPDRLR